MAVAGPDDGLVPDADAPVAASSGLVALTPENSSTLRAITEEDLVRAVTEVTAGAFTEYQISPSEL